MSQADDNARFMEVATRDSRLSNSPVAGNMPACGSPSGAKTEEVQAGQPTQYAGNGPGFVPVTPTIQRLAAGVYHIEVINQTATFVPHRLVTDTLLRLPDSKSDFVISEIERFWTLKEKFRALGFTHKRGFLLWGPPGSGKTCTVAVTMQQMVAQDGVVFLANGFHPSGFVRMLHAFRQVEPNRPCVVVIEDIDAFIREYGEQLVLSILDGEDSIDNVVYIATTNYPENLDGRVVNRPSRFDRVIPIDTPNAAARHVYLESRGLGLSRDELERWVESTAGFSIAHLKELIIGVHVLGGSLADEVERLRTMSRQPKSDGGKAGVGFGRN